MTNEAQKSDPRFWAKWRKSGAIGNMLTAVCEPIRKSALPIVGICEFHSGDHAGQATLSIGEKVVNSGIDSTGHRWTATSPVLYVVVPNHEFKLGQKVRTKDLPKGTSTIQNIFRR